MSQAERRHHGDTVVDEYAWLADKQDPETIAFLEAQNAYTAAITADQADLREAIFGEIKGRTKETDLRCRSGRAAGGTTPARWRASSTPCDAGGRSARTDQGPPMSEDGVSA